MFCQIVRYGRDQLTYTMSSEDRTATSLTGKDGSGRHRSHRSDCSPRRDTCRDIFARECILQGVAKGVPKGRGMIRATAAVRNCRVVVRRLNGTCCLVEQTLGIGVHRRGTLGGADIHQDTVLGVARLVRSRIRAILGSRVRRRRLRSGSRLMRRQWLRTGGCLMRRPWLRTWCRLVTRAWLWSRSRLVTRAWLWSWCRLWCRCWLGGGNCHLLHHAMTNGLVMILLSLLLRSRSMMM